MRVNMKRMIALTWWFDLIVSCLAVEAPWPQYPNETRRIPEIKQGEKCSKGQIYRMGCNTCHCGPGSNLVCTKMACLNPQDLKKLKSLRSERKRLARQGEPCNPGELHQIGCKKCFCNDKKELKCSLNDCKLAEKPKVNPGHIHSHNGTEFFKLTPLPHQGSKCQPGVTYRIDCNTCLCLANANLVCETLLCPSYDDVYRLKSNEMSGKPCNGDEFLQEDCLECRCVANKYACEAHPVCRHSDGRRMTHGEFPSTNDRNFLDLDKSAGGSCTPGMVYKVHCNKCYCQEDSSLRCTQKTCLNYQEVEKLKRIRVKLALDDQED